MGKHNYTLWNNCPTAKHGMAMAKYAFVRILLCLLIQHEIGAGGENQRDTDIPKLN